MSKTACVSRMKMAGGLLVTAALLALGSQAHSQEGPRGPAAPEVRGLVKSVDAAAGTITIKTGFSRDRQPVEATYSLAKDVEVALGGAFGRFGGGVVAKEGKLGDLAEGTIVALTLATDKKTVESIGAEEPTARGKLKAVDANKNTLTITLAPTSREQAAGEEKTYSLAKDAEIAADDGRGSRLSIKEAKLADLAEGAIISLRLSIDKKLVHGVLAEGPSHFGTVKELDAGKKTLTLVIRPPRGDDAGEEMTLNVPEDAVVLLDDGRGRRLSVKRGKLADVPAKSSAMVRLTADGQFAALIRAQGPMLFGQLKAVDPAKGTITIAIPKGRGEDPEEKTLSLAKNAWINIDGNPAKTADLKVEENAFVQVRLSLDQKMVQGIMARKATRR